VHTCQTTSLLSVVPLRILVWLLSFLIPTSSSFAQLPKGTEIPAHPLALRSQAKVAPLPVYPSQSIDKKITGRVVVEVHMNIAGKVSTIKRLETPDPQLTEAVELALKEWTFEPFREMSDRSPIASYGTMIFYFQITNGKPLVIDAGKEALAQKAAQDALTVK